MQESDGFLTSTKLIDKMSPTERREALNRHYKAARDRTIARIYPTLSPFWLNVFMSKKEEFDWIDLSSGDLTFELIYDYYDTHDGDFPWDWRALSWNKNLRWDIIVDCLYATNDIQCHKKENEFSITQTAIGCDIKWIALIGRYMKKWDWDGISRNKYITWDLMITTKFYKWSDIGASYNPNITIKEVEAYPNGPDGYPWAWKWNMNVILAKK